MNTTSSRAGRVLALCTSEAEGRAACGGTLARHAAEGRSVKLAAVKPAGAAALIARLAPEILYLPPDGALAEAALAACAGSARPRRALAFERLPGGLGAPTVFVDIEPFLDHKIEICRRSGLDSAARALALLRGSQAGFRAGEAFTLLWNIEA